MGEQNERRVIGYDVGTGGDGGPVYARADGAGEGAVFGDDCRLDQFSSRTCERGTNCCTVRHEATPESEGTGASMTKRAIRRSDANEVRRRVAKALGGSASIRWYSGNDEVEICARADFPRSPTPADVAALAAVGIFPGRDGWEIVDAHAIDGHARPNHFESRAQLSGEGRACPFSMTCQREINHRGACDPSPQRDGCAAGGEATGDADELARLLPGLAADIATVCRSSGEALPKRLARAAELLTRERERLTKRVAELEAAGRVTASLAKDFAAQAAAEQSIRNWLRAHGHDLSRPWDEVVIALLEAPPVGSVAEAMAQIDNAIANTKNATPDDLYTIGSHDAYVTAARILRSAIAPSPIGTRDLYVPSEEHRTTEPLCAALARGGATKDEAIEWLTRAMLDWKKQAAHLALLQPPAPIIIERDAPSPVTPPLSLAPRWLALPPAARSRVAARLHDALRDVRHEMDAEDIEANEALIELASAEPSGMDAIVAEVVARVEAVGVAASTRPAIAVADAWQWIGREAKEKRGREGFLTIATMAIHGMIDGDAAKGGST